MAKDIQPWDRLRITRELAGHTMTSLSQAAPCSLSYINDLEKGRRNPNPAITLKLARALNVPVSYIEKEDRIEGRAS